MKPASKWLGNNIWGKGWGSDAEAGKKVGADIVQGLTEGVLLTVFDNGEAAATELVGVVTVIDGTRRVLDKSEVFAEVNSDNLVVPMNTLGSGMSSAADVMTGSTAVLLRHSISLGAINQLLISVPLKPNQTLTPKFGSPFEN